MHNEVGKHKLVGGTNVPWNGGGRGLGPELLTSTNDLTNVAWQTAGATRTGGQTDPFGGTAAAKVTFPGGVIGNGSQQLFFQQLSTITAGTYRFAVWLKTTATPLPINLELLVTVPGSNYHEASVTPSASWTLFSVNINVITGSTSYCAPGGYDGNDPTVVGQAMINGDVYYAFPSLRRVL